MLLPCATRATTAAPYWGLKADNYHLVNNGGQLASEKSIFPFGSVQWQHEVSGWSIILTVLRHS